MVTRRIDLDGPLDLAGTLRPLVHGLADRTIRIGRDRFARATRTPDGPAAVLGRLEGRQLVVEAWGPGAAWALDRIPALVGQQDDRGDFRPGLHPLVADLDRRLLGHRIGRTDAVLESLVPAILEQKVTGKEASRAVRLLGRAHGEPAPGPLGLRLPPPPEVLAGLPYHAFHPFGVERRRADVIRRIAARARRLEELSALPPAEATRRLRTLPGIGPWTAAEVAIRAFGDPDAVSVGDFHTKHLVAWALAREPRGTDERMLELLEPWAGQRGRVVRLLEASGIAAPRYGPRLSPRRIDEM
jgi:3-methyladenine DNA glycosylase/8-oxoguanine DNA glycosylase